MVHIMIPGAFLTGVGGLFSDDIALIFLGESIAAVLSRCCCLSSSTISCLLWTYIRRSSGTSTCEKATLEGLGMYWKNWVIVDE